MSYKKLMVFGGALLIAAGCSSPSTSPIRSVNGGASNTTTAAPGQTKKVQPTSGQTMNSMASDSTGTCIYMVNSGYIGDSTCVRQDQ